MGLMGLMGALCLWGCGFLAAEGAWERLSRIKPPGGACTKRLRAGPRPCGGRFAFLFYGANGANESDGGRFA